MAIQEAAQETVHETVQETTRYRDLKSQKQFLKMMGANIVNRFGDSVDTIAFSWIMYEITKSAPLMAFIIGMNFLPTALLMPFAGVIADFSKKKPIMVGADIGRGLAVAVVVVLYQMGKLTPPIILAFVLLNSTLEAFRIPASGALVRHILDERHFSVGQAANYSMVQIASLVGFSVVGVIIAVFGSAVALWIDAVTFFISAVLIAWIRSDDAPVGDRKHIKDILENLKFGFRYLKTNDKLIALTAAAVSINFSIMTVIVFKTPYISDYLMMDVSGLSIFLIFNMGALFLGAAIAPKIKWLTPRQKILAGGFLMGIGLMVYAVVPHFQTGGAKIIGLALCAMLPGIGGGFINVVIGAARLKIVPKEIYGRVMGIIGAIMVLSMPISSWVTSALATALPLTTIFLAFGILEIVFFIVLMCIKALRGI